jgi:hypothetical protein
VKLLDRIRPKKREAAQSAADLALDNAHLRAELAEARLAVVQATSTMQTANQELTKLAGQLQMRNLVIAVLTNREVNQTIRISQEETQALGNHWHFESHCDPGTGDTVIELTTEVLN